MLPRLRIGMGWAPVASGPTGMGLDPVPNGFGPVRKRQRKEFGVAARNAAVEEPEVVGLSAETTARTNRTFFLPPRVSTFCLSFTFFHLVKHWFLETSETSFEEGAATERELSRPRRLVLPTECYTSLITDDNGKGPVISHVLLNVHLSLPSRAMPSSCTGHVSSLSPTCKRFESFADGPLVKYAALVESNRRRAVGAVSLYSSRVFL